LGHSQYRYLPFIQIASLAGVYGVSFFLVLVNAVLAELISSAVALKNDARKPDRLKRAMGSAACTAAVIGAVYLYGLTVLGRPAAGDEIKIAVAQGNIDRAQKWNPKFASNIIKIYTDLTRKGAERRPDLIIWPEAATPRSVAIDNKLHQYIQDLSREINIPILLGSTHVRKIRAKTEKKAEYRNSVFLFNPKGGDANQRHDKIRLMPFGEYVPAKDIIPWSYIKIPEEGSFTAGDVYTLFQLREARFGVTVCWESIFPDLARKFVREGAQFMVNVTNEGWFGPTAPYQFLASNVFRAVENRVFFVRSANIGISCFIDPHGRIIDRVRDRSGKDIHVRGTLMGSVIPLSSKTFYTRYGDVFAILCIINGAVFLMVALLTGESPHGSKAIVKKRNADTRSVPDKPARL
jgi:apolipoprotein N-acyltransferase